MIIDYFKSRKELLYFLGGLGLGAFFGKFTFLIALAFIGYIIWTIKKEEKEEISS